MILSNAGPQHVHETLTPELVQGNVANLPGRRGGAGHPGGHRVVTCVDHGTTVVWDADTGEVLRTCATPAAMGDLVSV